MNTVQLECFVSVAEHLNFSRASESLHVSQPAVSHQIQTLENELGVKLFKRTSKSVELTEEGRKIAKKIYARHVLLEEFLRRIGVSSETANHDACRMEHTISEESYKKIQELVRKMKEENTLNEEMKLTN